jgi:hypothetical protein
VATPPPTLPEPIRDALGLVRTLFTAAKDAGHHGRIVATTEAGRALKTALGFAHLDADTLGARSIPGHVERAFTALGKVPWPPEVELLIRIARARCLRQATPSVSRRPAVPDPSSRRERRDEQSRVPAAVDRAVAEVGMAPETAAEDHASS